MFSHREIAYNPQKLQEEIWGCWRRCVTPGCYGDLQASCYCTELRLPAVIITQEGGAQCDSDLMVRCEKCEAEGLLTVIIAHQSVSEDGTESNLSLADFSPLADAIVTTGNGRESVKVPRIGRPIGLPCDFNEMKVTDDRCKISGKVREAFGVYINQVK